MDIYLVLWLPIQRFFFLIIAFLVNQSENPHWELFSLGKKT